jgi:hypothetical protein
MVDINTSLKVVLGGHTSIKATAIVAESDASFLVPSKVAQALAKCCIELIRYMLA